MWSFTLRAAKERTTRWICCAPSSVDYPPGSASYARSLGRIDAVTTQPLHPIPGHERPDGVDDATWEYHLRKGEYSDWFAVQIKDPELAAEVREIEHHRKQSPQESRAAVRKAVEKRYTLPADKPTGIVEPHPAAR